MSKNQLTTEQFNNLQDSFYQFDADGSGHIDAKELETVVKETVGQTLSDAELQNLFKQLDTDNNKQIDFNEFVVLMMSNFYDSIKISTNLLSTELFNALHDSFYKFDADKNGYIDVKELETVVTEALGQNLSETEIKELIKGVDTNFDRKLSFAEFIRLKMETDAS